MFWLSKLFIVGGSTTESLSKYLKDKGSFELAGNAVSLVSEQRSLAAKTIIADKLILYLQDRDLKFKQELMSLRKLVFGDSFFLFSELYVFLRADDPDKPSVEELLTIFLRDVDNRSDLNSLNVHITDTKDEYTFSDVYNTIIGESHIQNMENQRIAKVRKPRDDDARYAYAPADDLEKVIKPYSYANVLRQEEIEKNAILAETGDKIVEKPRDFRKTGKAIPLVEVEPVQTKEVFMFVGDDNSGKSLLGVSIAIAASMEQKKTCFIDMKKDSDLTLIFEKGMEAAIPFSSVSLTDVYCYKVKHPDQYSFTLLEDMWRESGVLLLVNFLSDLGKMPYDLIVLEVSTEFYRRYGALLSSFISLVVFMAPSRLQDVKALKQIIGEERNVLVALTDFMPATRFNPAIETNDVKKILGMEKKILAPLDLKQLKIPKSLYSMVRGVIK